MAYPYLKNFDVVKNERRFSIEPTNLQRMKEEISDQYSIPHSVHLAKMVDNPVCEDDNFDGWTENVKRRLFIGLSRARLAVSLVLTEKASELIDQKLGSL